jgi:Uma2 family endonuclease
MNGRRYAVATVVSETCTPDMVLSFSITPGTFLQFLEAIKEIEPRLKCFEGSVTLVSPGRSHETAGRRLLYLMVAVFEELRIHHTPLASTRWTLPAGQKATAYEPDEGYYIQSHANPQEGQVPDLAIEIVVSNPEKKALACGAALGIPEMWVLDIPHHRLAFYRLMTRGKHKGTYQRTPRSQAMPFLFASEVLERLDDPDQDALDFLENCREWARRVLVPRHQQQGE